MRPAAAASAPPVTAIASGRRLRATGDGGAARGGSVRGASTSTGPAPGEESADEVDIVVTAARQILLSGAPCCRVRGILRFNRRRQRERAVRIRVRPVGRAVLPEALGQPDQLL